MDKDKIPLYKLSIDHANKFQYTSYHYTYENAKKELRELWKFLENTGQISTMGRGCIEISKILGLSQYVEWYDGEEKEERFDRFEFKTQLGNSKFNIEGIIFEEHDQ